MLCLRLNFDKTHTHTRTHTNRYADDLTAQEFDRQRINFRAANDFDVHQSYSESYIIRGYEQYALCCRHGVKPCFLGFGGYFLSVRTAVVRESSFACGIINRPRWCRSRWRKGEETSLPPALVCRWRRRRRWCCGEVAHAQRRWWSYR